MRAHPDRRRKPGAGRVAGQAVPDVDDQEGEVGLERKEAVARPVRSGPRAFGCSPHTCTIFESSGLAAVG